jgi:hypothetical protein
VVRPVSWLVRPVDRLDQSVGQISWVQQRVVLGSTGVGRVGQVLLYIGLRVLGWVRRGDVWVGQGDGLVGLAGWLAGWLARTSCCVHIGDGCVTPDFWVATVVVSGSKIVDESDVVLLVLGSLPDEFGNVIFRFGASFALCEVLPGFTVQVL